MFCVWVTKANKQINKQLLNASTFKMPKGKDGIDNILLYFDSHDLKFRAGDDITGKIVVHVDETTPTRGVILALKGRMNIFWRKVEGGSTVDFAEIEDYLDEKLKVWMPKKSVKDEMWLFPGVHEYPFSYTLPIDLPESMEDSRYAKIIYTIKASVLMPKGRVSHSMEDTFYVSAVPDPSVPKPAEDDLPKARVSFLFGPIQRVNLFVCIINRFS